MTDQERQALLALSKEELMQLLEAAMEGAALTTKNMQSMLALLEAASEEIKQLKDKQTTLEAELIATRNRPA